MKEIGLWFHYRLILAFHVLRLVLQTDILYGIFSNRFHRQHLQEEPQGIQRSSPGLGFVACNSVSWEFFCFAGFCFMWVGKFSFSSHSWYFQRVLQQLSVLLSFGTDDLWICFLFLNSVCAPLLIVSSCCPAVSAAGTIFRPWTHLLRLFLIRRSHTDMVAFHGRGSFSLALKI